MSSTLLVLTQNVLSNREKWCEC